MEHNDAQLGERDSSAIRGTGGHMTVGSFYSSESFSYWVKLCRAMYFCASLLWVELF